MTAAREGAAVLLSYTERTLNVEEKGRRADIVTDADRAAETAIVNVLRNATPAASILAEEGGSIRGTSDERWIVDPLDGTTNYAHGYPLYCVSIAYERAGELIAGVIYAPALNECYVAEKRAGARCNDSAIAVSKVAQVADAMVCTGFHPSDFERNATYFARASGHAQAVRRDGSAALDLAFTARGRFDGFWEWDLKPWDVAAGMLIVREAGGMISTIEGGEAAINSGSLLATNGSIHDELWGVLRQAQDDTEEARDDTGEARDDAEGKAAP